jgi:hypothetical protein
MISQVEFIALLLLESGIVRGVSSQTTLNQQTMQFTQSGHPDPRLAKCHIHAYDWIQHPCRNYRDYTRAIVYVDNTPMAALFAISIANLLPAQRVTKIVDLYFLTDMGRMSGESLLHGKLGEPIAPQLGLVLRPSWLACSKLPPANPLCCEYFPTLAILISAFGLGPHSS